MNSRYDGTKEMSDKDWLQWSDLLDKIMALPGTWEDKRNVLLGAAEKYNFSSPMGELVNWFEGTFDV